MRYIVLFVLCLLSACAPVETCDTGPVSGSVACRYQVYEMCSKAAECCGTDGGVCPAWAQSIDDCRAHYTQAGFDCDTAARINATVCSATVDECFRAIAFGSCDEISQHTACAALP